jgi:8-oxo-dGTP pyrophosphatase MutT (NUDIX family)
LKEALSKRLKMHIQDESRKPSAVLVPFYYSKGQYYILFTRRTELVHYHKGEISFPGGGYHQDDGTLVNTALRESYEEIGLAPEDVAILGELDDMLTKGSHYVISPFVGAILPDYKFVLSSFETAELIQIPVTALLEKGCRREEPEIVLGDRPVIPYVYAYEGKLIIGATARILKQFLDVFIEVSGYRLSN